MTRQVLVRHKAGHPITQDEPYHPGFFMHLKHFATTRKTVATAPIFQNSIENGPVIAKSSMVRNGYQIRLLIRSSSWDLAIV